MTAPFSDLDVDCIKTLILYKRHYGRKLGVSVIFFSESPKSKFEGEQGRIRFIGMKFPRVLTATVHMVSQFTLYLKTNFLLAVSRCGRILKSIVSNQEARKDAATAV